MYFLTEYVRPKLKFYLEIVINCDNRFYNTISILKLFSNFDPTVSIQIKFETVPIVKIVCRYQRPGSTYCASEESV